MEDDYIIVEDDFKLRLKDNRHARKRRRDEDQRKTALEVKQSTMCQPCLPEAPVEER